MQPETRYARSGDVHIAYQVLGDGPIDLVFMPGWISHLELAWENPPQARFFRRLAGFCRLIRFDKRGTGLSDPVATVPTLEERIEDARAVMDAVGIGRASFFGLSEGGPMSLLFAATYPERTRALVVYGSFAVATGEPGSPWTAPEALGRCWEAIEHWGEGRSAAFLNPSLAHDPKLLEQAGRRERMSASPSMARALLETIFEMDVRDILPAVRVPTLVLHRRGDPIAVANGRYIAERVPGARFVELAGDDHSVWEGDAEAVLDEVETFLTGARPTYRPDRVLATILFTDIVGSTERATRLGDRRWREVLEQHHATVRRELERFRGREVDTAGDGFLAAFDGPARAIRCAHAIVEAVRPLGLKIRAGLHTGECELIGEKLGGIAVHVGARVAARAEPGQVLVSGTVKDLVAGSGIRFEDRGMHRLKGIPDRWRLFAVERGSIT